jgi:hypothetical protein
MRALATIHFSADNALRILNGNAPLSAFNKNNCADNGYDQNQHEERH